MEWLRDKIDDLRCENYNNNNFIPIGALNKFMTQEAIQMVISKSKIEKHKHQDITAHILKGNFRVFAVLIRIGYVDLMPEFIRSDQYQGQSSLDQRLPFSEEYLASIIPRNIATKFYKEQWEYAAPAFSKSTLPRDLDKKTILPFLHEEHITEGGFGRVCKITIHDAHHCFRDEDSKFIRKDFQVGRKKDPKAHFELELRNLSILGNVKHPYVIELLSAYTWNNTYSLVFPVLEKDLNEFMSIPRPEQFKSDSLVFAALARLSLGLRHVHNFVAENVDLEKIGCHHDLKPNNIFIADQAFILADFGLSTFKDISQDSKTTRRVGGTSYSAPECENIADPTFEKGRAGRKSDIWAFGCIIAEVLTYVIMGPKGVAEFHEKRTFTIQGFMELSTFHRGNDPNPEVDAWLSNLGSGAKTSRKALVQLIREMLQLDPNLRPAMEDVAFKLQTIALREKTYPIDELLDTLQQEVGDGESITLFVEYARYMSWKETCGLTPDGLQDDSGLRDLQFDTWLDTLSHFQDTLEQILDQLRGGNRMHLLLPLKYANNRLEKLFSPGMRIELQNRLVQRTVVTVDDYHLLAKTKDVLQSGPSNLHTSKLAQVKLMTEAVKEHWDTSSEEPRLEIDLKSIHLGRSLEHHTLGTIVNRDVLIEWLYYDTRVLPEGEAVQRAKRVDAVARLLNSIPHLPSFRLLRCSNFLHDPENSRFGLVFDLWFPLQLDVSPKSHTVTTLSKLLTERDCKKPSLGERFKLAQALASSISEFHKVGWLHRQISPHNIVFFQIGESPAYEHPFIIGFGRSRPSSANEFTQGPGQEHQNYQHPGYIQNPQRYRAEFDFYSIGVVLLEIAHWNLLEKFTNHRDLQLLNHEQFRQALVKNAGRESLRHRMGTRYCQAIQACLSGRTETPDQETESGSNSVTRLEQHFQVKVVDELAKCSA